MILINREIDGEKVIIAYPTDVKTRSNFPNNLANNPEAIITLASETSSSSYTTLMRPILVAAHMSSVWEGVFDPPLLDEEKSPTKHRYMGPSPLTLVIRADRLLETVMNPNGTEKAMGPWKERGIRRVIKPEPTEVVRWKRCRALESEAC